MNEGHLKTWMKRHAAIPNWAALSLAGSYLGVILALGAGALSLLRRQQAAASAIVPSSPGAVQFTGPTASLPGRIEALEVVGRRCTTVVIAHRLSTVQRCDRIYEFDRGEVKAFGYATHSHSNVAPYKLARRWVQFDSHDSDYAIYLRQIVPSAEPVDLPAEPKASAFTFGSSLVESTISGVSRRAGSAR